jgi:hypothetical protein
VDRRNVVGVFGLGTSNGNCTFKDERNPSKREKRRGTPFTYTYMWLSDNLFQPFKHGITEEGVVADTLYARMRTLFTHDAAKSGIPLVVLVHEEEMVRGVLTRSGIDVGSFTSVGTLLRSSQPQVNIFLPIADFRSDLYDVDTIAPNVLQISFSATTGCRLVLFFT